VDEKSLRPRLQACNPIVALIHRQSTRMPPTKTSPRLSTELLLPLLPLPQRQTLSITMPPGSPNTLSLENTPEPIPGLSTPVYEDIIYPPRPVLPHQPTSNTIAPENAPEDNFGLHILLYILNSTDMRKQNQSGTTGSCWPESSSCWCGLGYSGA
jgi:hypothetical protein